MEDVTENEHSLIFSTAYHIGDRDTNLLRKTVL